MAQDSIRIFPLGDSALTVEFGAGISEDLNDRAITLARAITADPFPGFIECVPAYASATVFYNLATVRKAFPQAPTAFAAVRSVVAEALSRRHENVGADPRPTIDIRVHFGGESGPDLEHVAAVNGFATDDVIEIFTAKPYRVFMLGFLPGFSYMGEVDERITTPRRDTPRLSVPKGSVGIAGRQTGIYSLESPGGWQLIGRTDVELFTPHAERPALLRAGDTVRFVIAE